MNFRKGCLSIVYNYILFYHITSLKATKEAKPEEGAEGSSGDDSKGESGNSIMGPIGGEKNTGKRLLLLSLGVFLLIVIIVIILKVIRKKQHN